MTAEALGITLDVVRPGLEINLPRLTGSYDVGAIRYSGNPSNHGRSRDAQSGQLLPSYGSLAGDFDFSTRLGLSGGGSPVNGSGTQLVLNDIYTSDGDGSNRNTLGIQTDLALDIYQTKV